MNNLTDLTYRCVSYPDFEPNHTWLRQMLLFVDEVYRIVPVDHPLKDSDDLRRLIELTDGAVRTCEPTPYIEINKEQAQTFGKALEQPNFINTANSKEMTFTISPDGTFAAPGWGFLHVAKIGPEVDRELRSRKMLRPSPLQDYWQMVPRGVENLVLGMLADQVAQKRGFDAVTDQPLAFALNSLNQCSDTSSPLIEGIIASTVASVHVPKDIGLLSVEEYVELRKRHADVRSEFAKMVRELKDGQRMNQGMSPIDFRDKLDGIVEHVGSEVKRFRDSKAASKFNEWVPFTLTNLVPIAATLKFGILPGIVTGVFSFAINAIAKLAKKTTQFSYPKVLQTLCAVDDAAGKAALRKLTKNTPSRIVK